MNKYTVLLQSIRPSRVPDLGGLDEIGPTSQVTAHLANVGIWFKKYVKIDLIVTDCFGTNDCGGAIVWHHPQGPYLARTNSRERDDFLNHSVHT